MTHGRPDFDLTGSTRTTYPVMDLGELAARVGSPVTFDRRGDVVWFDDFEQPGGKWQIATSGVGATVVRNYVSARNGTFSLNMITGDAVDNYATISRRMPMFNDQRVGVEANIEFSDNTKYTRLWVQWYDGTNYTTGAVRYNDLTPGFEVLTPGSVWVAITPTIGLYSTLHLWHNIKLVVDYETDKYVRLMVDGVEYDLSAYSLTSLASADYPNLFISLQVTNAAAGNHGIFLDDFIVTINEP